MRKVTGAGAARNTPLEQRNEALAIEIEALQAQAMPGTFSASSPGH
jgi:hypothetical protein